MTQCDVELPGASSDDYRLIAQILSANLDPLRQTALSAKRIRLRSNDQHKAKLTDRERFAAASGFRVRAITALKHFNCT